MWLECVRVQAYHRSRREGVPFGSEGWSMFLRKKPTVWERSACDSIRRGSIEYKITVAKLGGDDQ